MILENNESLLPQRALKDKKKVTSNLFSFCKDGKWYIFRPKTEVADRKPDSYKLDDFSVDSSIY